MTYSFLASAVMLAGLLALPSRALEIQQPPKIDEFKMTTYQVVLVKKGKTWDDAAAPEISRLRGAHREYVAGLIRDGRAVVGGPFTGDGELRGMYITPGSPEQARELANADPGVQAGWWAVEILPWMGPEGWFQKPPDVGKTETLYFGFLLTGANTATIPAEETQSLMRGHLDYMDGQSKQGKLVMAGPLIKVPPRRGLIVYRVASMEEAIERASADPMVKAGRMKPEFHEWTVPAGILK